MITNRSSGEDGTDRTRLYGSLGLAAALAIPLLMVWWPGCRQYPPVSSRESLSLMRLLYTACNTRDAKRLGDVETGVEKLMREEKMSPIEKASFDRIVAVAKSGEWDDAQKAAFKFAQDQVGQGDDTPDRHDSHEHLPQK